MAQTILQEICKHGEVQTNAADRKKAMEDKRKQIINYLSKYYVNPKTGKPHPVVHLENAWDAAKLKIDLDEPVDVQVKKAQPKLIEQLPIKRAEMEGKLKVPHAHLGAATGIIKKYCSIHSENYTSEGVEQQIAIVPGDFDVFMKEMSAVTKGEFSFDIDGGTPIVQNDNNAKGGKGKGGGGGGGGGGKGKKK